MTRPQRHSAFSIPLSAFCILICITSGCITHASSPTPATAVDPVTATPRYWLNKPAPYHATAADYDLLWYACEGAARHALFRLDREDYRDGVIITYPLISRQVFEFWRPDTPDIDDALKSSLSTIRRTIRFDITSNADGTWTATPKVLVEHWAQAEHRITTAFHYRSAFGLTPAETARTTAQDAGAPPPPPPSYWYATGRDDTMEKRLAAAVRDRLE